MPRRLIVCADGTWNTQDAPGGPEPPPTNVVKMARAIRPVAADGTSQIVLYHEGVGNDWGLARQLGGAFGFGLSRNIRTCYRFLVDNYDEGDELYLFGFSRGAYTVRSLAGMIRNSGLLRNEYAHLIPRAYDLYRGRSRESHPNSVDARAFRKAYAHEVRIKCLGVWDSVGSLGIPTAGILGAWSRRRHGFHDVTLSGHVEHAYHALAIDERRKPFQPTLWEVDTPQQDVEQVWFAGVHANVGGGYDDCGLSDLALEWMMEKAHACGLEYEEEYVRMAVSPCPTSRLHDSMGLLYRLLGDGTRVIREPRPLRDGRPVRTCESIHPSVYERVERCARPPRGPYAPRNLPPVTATSRAVGRTSTGVPIATTARDAPNGARPSANAIPRRSTPIRLDPSLLDTPLPAVAAPDAARPLPTEGAADAPPVSPPMPTPMPPPASPPAGAAPPG